MFRSVSALCVLWTYIAAGAAAFCMMFIFPPGSLFILFFALISLGFVVMAMKALGWIEHHLALRSLSRGLCPECECDDTLIHDDTNAAMCTACGSAFAADGERANESPKHIARAAV